MPDSTENPGLFPILWATAYQPVWSSQERVLQHNWALRNSFDFVFYCADKRKRQKYTQSQFYATWNNNKL